MGAQKKRTRENQQIANQNTNVKKMKASSIACV